MSEVAPGLTEQETAELKQLVSAIKDTLEYKSKREVVGLVIELYIKFEALKYQYEQLQAAHAATKGATHE